MTPRLCPNKLQALVSLLAVLILIWVLTSPPSANETTDRSVNYDPDSEHLPNPAYEQFPETNSFTRSCPSDDPDAAVEPRSAAAPPLNATYLVPNNVFYVWCGYGRPFEFRHYLSVLSVIRFLHPDNIVLLYDPVEPMVDEFCYSTWLTEVERMFPFFSRQRESGLCGHDDGERDRSVIAERLRTAGGIYMHEEVVLTRPVHHFRTASSAVFLGRNGSELVKMSAAEGTVEGSGRKTNASMKLRCAAASAYRSRPGKGSACVRLRKDISPKDVWELDDPLGRLLRTIAYGKPDLARPEPSYDELVPNIGHVISIGDSAMKLEFYLCVLSLLHVANVDAVYVHGQAPNGFYWDLVKTDRRVKIVPRAVGPNFGNTNPMYNPAVMSDIWRTDILLKYGGIYVDTDSLFVRPLTRAIRGYDAVATKDINTALNTIYPDHINLGVTIAKPNSRFWKLLQKASRHAVDDDRFWIGVRLPYKIKERHPDTLLIEPRLQVLCFESKCRPTWTPDYQNDSVNQLTTDVLRNWRNDTFAFHMTWPTPQEFESYTALLSSNSTIADIGRYVLERAGMLPYFRRLPVEVEPTNDDKDKDTNTWMDDVLG